MRTEYVEAPPSLDGAEGRLAVIVYAGQSPAGAALCDRGVHFLTEPERGQQVALIRHPAGHEVTAHRHLPHPARRVSHTGEVILVHRGKLVVDFFTSGGEPVCSRTLVAGDLLVLLAGGHGFTVLEECELVEVKQGPYHGKKHDKVPLFPYEYKE